MDELDLIRGFRRDDSVPRAPARAAAHERLMAHMVDDCAATAVPGPACAERFGAYELVCAFRQDDVVPRPAARTAARDQLAAHIGDSLPPSARREPPQRSDKRRVFAAVRDPDMRAQLTSSLASRFALDLMLEDEERHGSSDGYGPWLLPLTAGGGYDRVSERLRGLSAALAREHRSRTWSSAQATSVDELAELLDVAPNRLFAHYAPRVRLTPFIAQAFLTVLGGRQTGAYELYARAGLCSHEAHQAYGAHKEPRRARAMVLGGLAAISGETVTPVSMFPVSHGTWDDPNHKDFGARQAVCNAQKVLEPFGLTPDGSVAGFAAEHFRMLRDGRALLERAAKFGSSVCVKHAVDPRALLELGMPARVVIGGLSLGASATDGSISHIQHLPGLNAELHRVARAHDIAITAHALDHLSDMGSQLLTQLKGLSITEADTVPLYGRELIPLLVGEGRWSVPGLDEIPAVVLDALAEPRLVETYGVKIDSQLVQYFRVCGRDTSATNAAPVRVRLLDQTGSLDVCLLARVTERDMVMWSTTQSLTGPNQIASIAVSELHRQMHTAVSPVLCFERFFNKFTPHQAKPRDLRTRVYMWVSQMLANLGTLGTVADMPSESGEALEDLLVAFVMERREADVRQS